MARSRSTAASSTNAEDLVDIAGGVRVGRQAEPGDSRLAIATSRGIRRCRAAADLGARGNTDVVVCGVEIEEWGGSILEEVLARYQELRGSHACGVCCVEGSGGSFGR